MICSSAIVIGLSLEINVKGKMGYLIKYIFIVLSYLSVHVIELRPSKMIQVYSVFLCIERPREHVVIRAG